MCARHLHQRQDALLHACTAGRDEEHERRLLLGRGLEPGNDAFADAMPSEPPMKSKILHGYGGRHALDRTDRDFDGIGHARLGARIAQTVRIALLIAKLQRIERTSRMATSSAAPSKHMGESIPPHSSACGIQNPE